MLTNACFFRIAPGFELPEPEALEAVLRKGAFVPCGPTQPISSGWISPRGPKSRQLAEVIGGHLLLKLQTETRSVPSSAVKAAVEERCDKYKQETGNERVPSKVKKEFKEEVLLDLLPRAFSKRGSILLWLDVANSMLVVDAPSLGAADRIVSSLIGALLDVPGAKPLDLQLVQTQTSPEASMAHWLVTREAPWRFTVDRDCELKTPDEQKSTVRYMRHTLETDEVVQHVAAGKVPTLLSMTWNDRVSFVLTAAGQIRKIKLLDVVTAGGEGQEKADQFDADAAIITGELSALLPDLLLALGGEVLNEVDAQTGEMTTTPVSPTAGEELYARAVAVVREHQLPGISLLQRHLQIGYNSAASLLEEMERAGVVSAMDSKGQRTIGAQGARA